MHMRHFSFLPRYAEGLLLPPGDRAPRIDTFDKSKEDHLNNRFDGDAPGDVMIFDVRPALE